MGGKPGGGGVPGEAQRGSGPMSPPALTAEGAKRESAATRAKLHHRAQMRRAAPAGGNSLCELNRLSEGCQRLNDARTSRRGGGASPKTKCGFRYILEKRASLTLGPSRVSFPHHRRRLWADQIRCPGTFQRGRPPPPGPKQGFLLSPGETASPGTPGFLSSVGGDQAKPAATDLDSGAPRNSPKQSKN